MGKEKRGEERLVKRILISNNKNVGNLQDEVRKERFKNSEEGEFCHEPDPRKIIDIILKEKEKNRNVQLMVGIDNFKCTQLESFDELN